MEKGQHREAFSPQCDGAVGRSDERECTGNHADIIARRQKNRERQRRYRERKRLAAEANKVPGINPVVPRQAEGILKRNAIRVYCGRDWKKDARSVHASKQPAVTFSSQIPPTSTLPGEIQIACLRSDVNTDSTVDCQLHLEKNHSQSSGQTRRMVHGRRNWKAEARKKKA